MPSDLKDFFGDPLPAVFHGPPDQNEWLDAAAQAKADGVPDPGVWAIAMGLMTRDEVDKKFADIFNRPTEPETETPS